MFSIKVTKNGLGSVIVNGKDLSNYTKGFNIFASAGSITKLELELSGELEIEGEGDIILRLPNGDEFKVKKVKELGKIPK